MDLAKVLAQLRSELENLNMAIASLERLATQTRASQAADRPDPPRRPGRPRKNPAALPDPGLAIKRGSK